MRKLDVGIYPFTETFIPNLNYKELYPTIHINLLIDYNGITLSGEEVVKKSSYANEFNKINWNEIKQENEIETLIVTQKAEALEIDKVLEVVEKYCKLGVNIWVMEINTLLADKIMKLCTKYNVTYKNKEFLGDKEKIDYQNFEYSLTMEEITTPVISIAQVAPVVQIEELQLNLLYHFLKDGYKAVLIGSGELLGLLGQYSISEIMKRELPEVHKIYYLNNVIHEIERKQEPDIILIGIPDPIVPLTKRHMFHFGIFASEIFNAVSPDIAFVTLINGDYNDEFYHEMNNLCKYKYNFDVDAYFISRFIPTSASMYREKLSFTYSEKIEHPVKEGIFTNEDIQTGAIYKALQKKLLQFGRCEQF